MSAGHVVSGKPGQAAALGAQRLHLDSSCGMVSFGRNAIALSLMPANYLADAHLSARARVLCGPSGMCASRK